MQAKQPRQYKQPLIDHILKNSSKWKIKGYDKPVSYYKKMTISQLVQTKNKINDHVQKVLYRIDERKQNQELQRKSGVTVQTSQQIQQFQVGEDQIQELKRIRDERQPNQIIKVDATIKGQRREVNIDDYLENDAEYYNWSGQGTDSKINGINTYSVPLSGSCYAKGGAKFKTNLNGWIFDYVSVKTQDGDCIFAVMNKFANCKRNAKKIRSYLGLPQSGSISSDCLQQIVDFYGMSLVLYYPLGEEIIPMEFIPKELKFQETVAKILLLKDHYWYVEQVTMPQEKFEIVKQKFQKMNTKHIISDQCKFEKKNEDDFIDFEHIAQYIFEQREKHILIHGQGGVGKSFLKNLIEQQYKINEQDLLITSTSGISAINIGASTIHSELVKCGKKGFKCDVLIDEIGFLDGNLFQEIIQKLNGNRLILLGDLLQLPPVKASDYGFFFESSDYKDIFNNLTMINLHRIKRQDDVDFQQILSKIRFAQYDKEVYQYLLKYKIQNRDALEDEITACSKRAIAKEYNDRQIKKLIDAGALERQYQKTEVIDHEMINKLFGNKTEQKNAYIAKISNQLKQNVKSQTFYIGEKVILTKNFIQHGVCNGSRGVIVGFQEKGVLVKFDDKQDEFLVEKIKQYKRSIKEIFSEKIPLIPCYALTFHKCQGLTIKSPLLIDFSKVWLSSQVYVAISRVVSPNLLRLKNLPKLSKLETFKLCETVQRYLEEDYFEQFQFRMVVEDMTKQMRVTKFKNTDLYNQNSIYMDFETAEYEKNCGLVSHRPYYNNIRYFYKGELQQDIVFQDFGQQQEGDQRKFVVQDVGKHTFDFIMNIIQNYEQEVKVAKKSGDRQIFRQVQQNLVRIITYNGAGFDLYFLLDQILKTDNFSQKYCVKNIFKQNKLVYFQLYSMELHIPVMTSFDLYQLTAPYGLKTACQNYCPEVAKKLVFKNEIICLAKKRYREPEILDDCEQFIESVEFVTIKGLHQYKFDTLQKEDEWEMDEEDQKFLEKLADQEENIGRRFKVKIYKCVNLYQQLQLYADNDTQVLEHLTLALDKICHEVFDCSILHFLTAGSLCWYGFKQFSLKDIADEDIYDENRNLKLRKDGAQVKTQIYRNELEEEQFCTNAKYGGRVCPRIKQIQPVFENEENKYVYLDISGMYCDIMLKNKLPYGKKRWMNKEELQDLFQKLDNQKIIKKHENQQLFGLKDIQQKVLQIIDKHFENPFIIECEFEENPLSLEPVVQYKKKIAGTQENPIHKTIYTNERRKQIITSIDIITILLKGGKIHEISKGLVYEKQGTIMQNWMTKCLEIKNLGKQQKRPALTSFGKLLANGTYGQTLKLDRNEVIKFVDNSWDSQDFVQKYDFTNVFITDSDFDILIGSEKVDKQTWVTSRCSYIGVFVLAYTRLMIQNITQIYNPEQNPLYQAAVGDTDSLLIHEKLVRQRLIPSGFVQARSGCLADELADTNEQQFFFPPHEKYILDGKDSQKANPFAIPDEETLKHIKDEKNYKFNTVHEGYFVQPKTLGIKYMDNNKNTKTKIRAKGIPLNSTFNENEAMSYSLFVRLLEQSNNNQEYNQFQKDIGEKVSISKGIELQLPEGIKVITPSLVNGELKKFGEEQKTEDKVSIKKNQALFNIVSSKLTRKIFNTSYTGRAESRFNDNIYVPFGHPHAPPTN